MRDRFVRGVGVDLKRGAERAHGGEGIAGSHLAGDNGLAGGIDHLFIQRHAGLEGQAERYHTCTITDSTVEVKTQRTRLSRYESRIQREYSRCLKDLQTLQAARKKKIIQTNLKSKLTRPPNTFRRFRHPRTTRFRRPHPRPGPAGCRTIRPRNIK